MNGLKQTRLLQMPPNLPASIVRLRERNPIGSQHEHTRNNHSSLIDNFSRQSESETVQITEDDRVDLLQVSRSIILHANTK